VGQVERHRRVALPVRVSGYRRGGNMTEPLKTITVIVDRIVLVDILKTAAANENLTPAESIDVSWLAEEVESGERCELYARDWPLE
jgi:hypothetical protein